MCCFVVSLGRLTGSVGVHCCIVLVRSASRGRERAIANQTNIGTVSRATSERATSDRRGGAHLGLPERIDTILNRTAVSARLSPRPASFIRQHSFHLIFSRHLPLERVFCNHAVCTCSQCGIGHQFEDSTLRYQGTVPLYCIQALTLLT